MLVIGGISFVSGVLFLMIGAWPVFGFLGLDVLLVYWAFRANYRAARAYEEVIVTASELTVRKVSHHGRVREWTLNPVWVQLDRIVHEEFGIERLFLVSRGRRLTDCGLSRARTRKQALPARCRLRSVRPNVVRHGINPPLKGEDGRRRRSGEGQPTP